jgi:hypothetical protein
LRIGPNLQECAGTIAAGSVTEAPASPAGVVEKHGVRPRKVRGRDLMKKRVIACVFAVSLGAVALGGCFGGGYDGCPTVYSCSVK